MGTVTGWWRLAALYFGLQVYDLASTFACLHTGRGQEANPIMAPVIGMPVLAVLVKLGVAGVALLLSSALYRCRPRLSVWLLAGQCLWMGIVCVHNTAVYMQTRGGN